MSHIQVRKMTGGCGAEVLGVNLANLSNSDMEAVRQAYVDHGVIFFRDQSITPDEHIAFARRWGDIVINKFFTPSENPEIAEVRKEKEQTTNIGGGWHTDHSYDPDPAMGSILVARHVPDEGGDTLFASMYAAYDALSPGLKKTLEGMRAVHSVSRVFGSGGFYQASDQGKGMKTASPEIPEVTHPVVITHPESGRKALYVNPGFTLRFDGWTDQESQPLLDFLFAHASRPEFTCRFRWADGSVAFWDNRATWHYATNDYHGHERLMHRITIKGVPLG